MRLLGDADRDVRHSAVHALGRVGKDAEQVIPILIKLSKQDSDKYVRQEAISAVAAVDGDGQLAIPACIEALQDETPHVRTEAATQLGNFGPRAAAAVAALTDRLSDDVWCGRAVSTDCLAPDCVQFDAIEALGRIGPAAAPALPRLRKMLQEEGEGIRADVALAVLRIDPQDKQALPALIAMIREHNQNRPDMQKTASEQDADVESMGVEECRTEDALNALGYLDPSALEAVPAVKKALRHRCAAIREAAAVALAVIARKEAVPLLIEQLKEEKRQADAIRAGDSEGHDDFDNHSVRERIAEAFGKIGPDAAAAVPELILMLNGDEENDFFLRETAVASLGKINPAASVPYLIATLEEEHYYLDDRMKTIAAIGQIGPPAKAALPVLSNMAQSDAPGEIREAARAAIQKISPEKVPPEDK